jgi:hypothetical protein
MRFLSFHLCLTCLQRQPLTGLLYFRTRITENEITAKKFNLSSFESWAPHLNLTPMEMSELQDLLGM